MDDDEVLNVPRRRSLYNAVHNNAVALHVVHCLSATDTVALRKVRAHAGPSR